MASQPTDPPLQDSQLQGRRNYEKGYAFEDRVGEAYRLLGYDVEHGRIFSGRQVDFFLQLRHGDLTIRRALECKAGDVTTRDIDNLLTKLRLVQREFPDTLGTLVGGGSFTDAVTAHAAAEGIQLTQYRDLSTQIIDANSYAKALLRESETNETYPPSLFVEPTMAYAESSQGLEAFEVIDEWLKHGDWKQLTLLGDVGTGKSFLCHIIAQRLAQQYLDCPTENPLPLLVDLRNADREFSLEGLILTHFARRGLGRATFDIFEYLLTEGRLVLILDGFDEMASKITPLVTTRNFHELARCVKGQAKVLLTCRTHYFKSRTEEEETVLGGAGKNFSELARDLYWDLISRSGFKIAYLRPFSISQVDEYIEKACGERAKAVRSKIDQVYNLTELSQRPMLLDMIVRSIDRLTISEINAVELYRVFTGVWVNRDQWRDVMQPDEKLSFVMALARTLWGEDLQRIHYQKLQEYVGTTLSKLIDDPQRLIELDGEIRTASFLVRDEGGHYGFAHSSYAEYFLARFISDRINDGDYSSLATRRFSSEVIDFVLGLVDRESLEADLSIVLTGKYKARVSENALLILYRLRRNILVKERGLGGSEGASALRVEMPSVAQLQGARLSQVTLEGAVLASANFDGADLRQAIARGADLEGASLRGASLEGADLERCVLREVDASSANFVEANLNGADVYGCSLDKADLSASVFAPKNVEHASFHEAIGRGIILPEGLAHSISGIIDGADSAVNAKDQAKLLEKIHRDTRKIAKALGSRGVFIGSEDIASEVVVFLLSNPTKLRKLRESSSGAQWSELRTMVRRILDRYVVMGSRALINESDMMHFDIEEVGDLYRDDDDFDKLMNEMLVTIVKDALSEDAYKLLLSRYAKGDSIKEIASQEGRTELQVARNLQKARSLARRAVEAAGYL